jgi:uncharacterized protein YkwD
MRRTLATIGTTLAAVCLLCGLLAQPAGAANPSLEAQVLALLQQQRSANGLPPFVVSAGLSRAAAAWSDTELAMGTIEHNPDPGAFLAPFWLRWGENVGVASSPAQLVAMWMASAPHRANILGYYNRIGVGVSLRGDGAEFATLDFELFPYWE